MKILVVSGVFPEAWSWGGQARSIWSTCRALRTAGAGVEVLTTNSDLEGRVAAGVRREQGIRIRTLPVWGTGVRSGRYALAPGLIGPILDRLTWADLVVVQGVWTWPMLITPRLCRLRGVPYVVIARGCLEGRSLSEKAARKALYWRLVESRAVRGARAVQFASEVELRNSVAAIGNTPWIISHNPVDAAAGEPAKPEDLRRTLGVGEDSVLLGMFGRVHPRKGFEIIIPALAALPPRCHLVAFGADERGFTARLEQIAHDHGVGHRVHFAGQKQGRELDGAYAAVDLVVVPSLGESFGNTVLEAMANGTEAMVSEGVPLKGYVEQVGGSAEVRPNDSATWARRLARWLASRGAFDPAAAADAVRRDYSPASVGRRRLADYRELLGFDKTQPALATEEA